MWGEEKGSSVLCFSIAWYGLFAFTIWIGGTLIDTSGLEEMKEGGVVLYRIRSAFKKPYIRSLMC